MTAATSLDLLATLAELVALLERGETPAPSLVRVAGDAVAELRRRHSPDLLAACRLGLQAVHEAERIESPIFLGLALTADVLTLAIARAEGRA